MSESAYVAAFESAVKELRELLDHQSDLSCEASDVRQRIIALRHVLPTLNLLEEAPADLKREAVEMTRAIDQNLYPVRRRRRKRARRGN